MSIKKTVEHREETHYTVFWEAFGEEFDEVFTTREEAEDFYFEAVNQEETSEAQIMEIIESTQDTFEVLNVYVRENAAE